MTPEALAQERVDAAMPDDERAARDAAFVAHMDRVMAGWETEVQQTAQRVARRLHHEHRGLVHALVRAGRDLPPAVVVELLELLPLLDRQEDALARFVALQEDVPPDVARAMSRWSSLALRLLKVSVPYSQRMMTEGLARLASVESDTVRAALDLQVVALAADGPVSDTPVLGPNSSTHSELQLLRRGPKSSHAPPSAGFGPERFRVATAQVQEAVGT